MEIKELKKYLKKHIDINKKLAREYEKKDIEMCFDFLKTATTLKEVLNLLDNKQEEIKDIYLQFLEEIKDMQIKEAVVG